MTAYPSNGELRVRAHWSETSPEGTSLVARGELSRDSDPAHGWYPTIPKANLQVSLFLHPEACG